MMDKSDKCLNFGQGHNKKSTGSEKIFLPMLGLLIGGDKGCCRQVIIALDEL
jgi:hypothetical protein